MICIGCHNFQQLLRVGMNVSKLFFGGVLVGVVFVFLLGGGGGNGDQPKLNQLNR